ncbi:MAG: serine protein kinase RIO [Candidatus Bathyarchaeota archaeon]|nr:MAG: serine protein kinase RIO [Candidatus Bathyarchaeota archaeon]
MSDRERVEKQAEAAERRYEEDSLMLKKRQEEYKTIEEVFDRPTLQGVFKLIHQKIIDEIFGVIKAGKEARIYWGKDFEGTDLAIKIYYTSTAEFRKGMMQYIQGDPRFKRVRKSPRGIIYTWTQKEYKNLQLVEAAGVNAPRPIAFQSNILVMTFIGEDGVPAPLLREEAPLDPVQFYSKLLDEMKLMYTKAGLVHGDLSEYNIMVWEESPVIFDVSQALLISHPLADTLIQRDITNVNSYFKKLDIETYDPDNVEPWIKGESEILS